MLYCCLVSLDSFRFCEKYFTAPPRFVANTECDFSILERNALQGNVASLPCSSASSEYDVDKHQHNWLISTLCSETKHGVSLDLHHFEHWSFTYLVWKCIPAPPAQRPAQTPNSGENKRDISRPIFRAMNLHMACLPTLPPPKNHREIAKKSELVYLGAADFILTSSPLHCVTLCLKAESDVSATELHQYFRAMNLHLACLPNLPDKLKRI